MKSLASRLSLLAAFSATLLLGQTPPPASPAPVPAASEPVVAPALQTAPVAPATTPPVLPASTNVATELEALPPSGAAVGAEQAAPAKPAKPAAPKLPGVGLRGSVSAVDAKAMTFTVTGKGAAAKSHVVHVASSSRYTHGGKPATISSVAVGDSFNGRIKKNKQGDEVLIQGSFNAPGAGKAASKAKTEASSEKPSAPAK